jgi:hypothetical protein
MSDRCNAVNISQVKMRKKEKRKEDGRKLIYYSFEVLDSDQQRPSSLAARETSQPASGGDD